MGRMDGLLPSNKKKKHITLCFVVIVSAAVVVVVVALTVVAASAAASPAAASTVGFIAAVIGRKRKSVSLWREIKFNFNCDCVRCYCCVSRPLLGRL